MIALQVKFEVAVASGANAAQRPIHPYGDASCKIHSPEGFGNEPIADDYYKFEIIVDALSHMRMASITACKYFCRHT